MVSRDGVWAFAEAPVAAPLNQADAETKKQKRN